MLRPADHGIAHGEPDRSFADLAHQVLDDGRAYVQAEADLLKARTASSVLRYRGAAQLAAGAVALAIAALVSLAVALVVILAHFIGPVGGGLLAVAIFASAAVMLALASRNAFRRAND